MIMQMESEYMAREKETISRVNGKRVDDERANANIRLKDSRQ